MPVERKAETIGVRVDVAVKVAAGVFWIRAIRRGLPNIAVTTVPIKAMSATIMAVSVFFSFGAGFFCDGKFLTMGFFQIKRTYGCLTDLPNDVAQQWL